jgi:DNA invertase Pin-like site-specific DNA recombinase
MLTAVAFQYGLMKGPGRNIPVAQAINGHAPSEMTYDLRQMAAQRGYEIIQEYTDKISGAKAKRPGLEQLLFDAKRHKFDVVLVWAFDRMARSVRHFLEILDELNRLNIEFISFRENIDTGGPLGRAMVVIVGAIAELERNLIVERVKAGMRRARLDGQRIGRIPLDLDRDQIVRDRLSGMSLTRVAKKHGCSRATVCRLIKDRRPTLGAIAGNQPNKGSQVLSRGAARNLRTA